MAKDNLGGAVYTLGASGVGQFVQQMGRAENAINRFAAPVTNLATNITSALNPITALAGALGGLAAGLSITGLIRLAAEAEDVQVAFETFLGSAKKAEKFIKDIRILAMETPLQEDELKQGARMLLGLGMAAEKVVPNLKMLGDVSRGIQKPLSDIAYIYGTLISQNTAYTVDIRQFAMRGIPIVEELAKHFKTTEDQIYEMASKGKIKFKDIEAAFKSMTSSGGRYAGLMQKASQTMNGLWSTFKDAVEVGVFIPLGVAVGKVLRLKDIIRAATDVATNFGRNFGPAIDSVVDKLTGAGRAASNLSEHFSGLFRNIWSVASALSGAVVPALTFAAAVSAVPLMSGSVAGLAALGKWISSFKILSAFGSTAASTFARMFGFVKDGETAIGFLSIFKGILGFLNPLKAFAGLMKLIGVAFTVLTSPVTLTAAAVVALVAVFAKMKGMGFMEYLGYLASSIAKIALKVWDWIRNSRTATAVVKLVSTAWYALCQIVEAGVKQLGRFFTWIGEIISPYVDKFTGASGSILESIDAWIARGVDAVTKFTDQFAILVTNADLTFQVIKRVVELFTQYVTISVIQWVTDWTDWIAYLADKAKAWFQAIYMYVYTSFANAGVAVLNFGQDILRNIEWACRSVVGWFRYAGDMIGQILTNVTTNIKDIVLALWEELSSVSITDVLLGNTSGLEEALRRFGERTRGIMGRTLWDSKASERLLHNQAMPGLTDHKKSPYYIDLDKDVTYLSLMERINTRFKERARLAQQTSWYEDEILQTLLRQMGERANAYYAEKQNQEREGRKGSAGSRWVIRGGQDMEPAAAAAGRWERYFMGRGANAEQANRLATRFASTLSPSGVLSGVSPQGLLGSVRSSGLTSSLQAQLESNRTILAQAAARKMADQLGPQIFASRGRAGGADAVRRQGELEARRAGITSFAPGYDYARLDQGAYDAWRASQRKAFETARAKAKELMGGQGIGYEDIQAQKRAGQDLEAAIGTRLSPQAYNAYRRRQESDRVAGLGGSQTYAQELNALDKALAAALGTEPTRGAAGPGGTAGPAGPTGLGRAAFPPEAQARAFAATRNQQALQAQFNLLLRSGVELDKLTDKWTTYDSIVYGSGRSFQTVFSYLQRIDKTAKDGKVSWAALNAAQQQGIPVLDAVAIKLGKSKSEIMEMAEDGKLSLEDVQSAIVDMGNAESDVAKKLKAEGYDINTGRKDAFGTPQTARVKWDTRNRLKESAKNIDAVEKEQDHDEARRNEKREAARARRQEELNKRREMVTTKARERLAARMQGGGRGRGAGGYWSISDISTIGGLGDLSQKMQKAAGGKSPEEQLAETNQGLATNVGNLNTTLTGMKGANGALNVNLDPKSKLNVDARVAG